MIVNKNKSKLNFLHLIVGLGDVQSMEQKYAHGGMVTGAPLIAGNNLIMITIA